MSRIGEFFRDTDRQEPTDEMLLVMLLDDQVRTYNIVEAIRVAIETFSNKSYTIV